MISIKNKGKKPILNYELKFSNMINLLSSSSSFCIIFYHILVCYYESCSLIYILFTFSRVILLTTRYALVSDIGRISIPHVIARSTIVITCKLISLNFLSFIAYFMPPFLGVVWYLPIKSINRVSHCWISGCLDISLP